MPMSSRIKSFFFDNTLTALLVLSLIFNGILATKLRHAQLASERLYSLQPGDAVPAILVQGDRGDGVLQQINWRSRPSVLYYFDPHCVWCKRNAAAFGSLVMRLGSRYQVYAYTASVDGLPEFVQSTHLNVRVITDYPLNKVREQLKLRGTPQTLWIGADGKLIKTWEGAYIGSVKDQIERAFSVRLPELITPRFQTASALEK
jgi:hypothetical protein